MKEEQTAKVGMVESLSEDETWRILHDGISKPDHIILDGASHFKAKIRGVVATKQ